MTYVLDQKKYSLPYQVALIKGRGEVSFVHIVRRAYGDENAWVKIAQANNFRNPNRIEAGWVLRLPR